MADPRVNVMVERAIWYCTTANVGYDQGNRWDFPAFGDAEYPGETDCSALTYQCGLDAGFNLPTSGARYTGTIDRDFRAAGFIRLNYTGKADVRYGDILLKDGHVAITDGTSIYEAYIDEKGGIRGGVAGDQANETRRSPWRDGWTYIYRYPDPEEAKMHKTSQEGYIYHAVHHDDGWVTIYISDYFNAVAKASVKDYYGNPYAEKTLYYPDEFEFVEPPYCDLQVRATSDLLNWQPYSLEAGCCKFWVWNVQTSLKRRWLIPRFSVDAVVHGKLKG
ncbi:MAG: hypothetical protein IJG53_08470 [Eggerthellaceae bacterium]|nr:hypothetical protein [Eggerthellaceae bacterium]